MIQDKKEKERSILNDFINGYDDFPKGQIRCNEAPDFILHINRKKSIGIELTELLHPQAKTSNYNFRQIDNLRSQILEGARVNYESKHGHKLDVVSDFGREITVSKNQQESFAVEIAQLVHNMIKENDFNESFYVTVERDKLPPYIAYLGITFHKKGNGSNWQTGEGSMINEFTKEIIDDTIIRKEEKLSHYKKKRLDIYWLIIWTNYLDRSSSFNYGNKLENWEFSSQFHKIFIFDVIIKKIFELNLTT